MADVNASIGVNIDTSSALGQLKSLQRQISQFHTSISRSSEAAALAQRDLQRNLLNSINSIGAFSAELRTVKTTAESFTDSLQRNKFSMREYFRFAGASSKTFGKLFKSEFETINKVAEDNVKRLQTQYIKLGRDSTGAMRAIAVMPKELDLTDYSVSAQMAAQRQALFNQLVKQGSTNLLNFGKNTQWAGRQLMVGFTIPLIALGSAASKTFMEMEAQVIKFRKVYGDLFTPAAERQQALEDITALGEMFTKYGIAVADTVGLAAEAAAAGFQGVDLQRQTTEATRLQVLGQIDAQKALETTISLQNAFQLQSEELADAINFLNAVENQTVVSLDDITTAIPKAAPVVKQLGGDVRDLAFFLSAMKEGGVNASEGANALKSGLASLINPTDKAKEMMKGFGIDIDTIVNKNAGNVKQTVIEFAQALDQLSNLNRQRAIEQLFGKFQLARLSTLFENVTKTGNQASRVLDLATASTEDLAAMAEQELGMTAESSMNKFRKAVENLQLALVPVGQAFLEAITPIIEFVGGILEKFSNLSSGVKKAITIITIAVGGIAPVLLMTFGLLANFLANAVKGAMILRNGYLRLTGQSQILSEQTQYLNIEQQNAAAVAHSLDQSHANLTQTFNVEREALVRLIDTYKSGVGALRSFAMANPGMMTRPRGYNNGVVMVPGSGNRDTVPAMLTPGEAVIPKEMAKKYGPLIQGIIADNIPGYKRGLTVSDEDFATSITSQAKVRDFIRRELAAIPEELVQPFKELVREIVREQNASVESLKASLKPFRAQYNKNIGGEQRPQFTHIGGGVSPTAGQLLRTGAVTNAKVADRLQRFSDILPEQEVRVKSGYAITMKGKINQDLAKTGADIQEFMQDFREQGLEKWKDTVKIGGGNFENLAGQIQDYDTRMSQALQRRIDSGASLIFDTRADIEEAAANARTKGQEFDSSVAIALDEVDFEVRSGIEFMGTELSRVFDTALRTITDIRVDLDARERQILQAADPELFADLGFGQSGGQPRFAKGGSTAGQRFGGYGVFPQGTLAIDSAVASMVDAAETQSPSQRTIPIGEDLVRGVQVGMERQSDRLILTGKTVAEDAVAGLDFAPALLGPGGQPIKSPFKINPALLGPKGEEIVAPSVSAQPSITQSEISRQMAVSKEIIAQGQKQINTIKESNNKLAKMNGAMMSATFAVSALSSITSLFADGPLASFSGTIAKLTGLMFALMSVTQLLTQSMFLQLIQQRAANAGLLVQNITTKKFSMVPGLFSGGLKKIIPNLLRFGGIISRFLGPIGIAVSLFTVANFWIKRNNRLREEERQKLEAFSDALSTTTDQAKFLGDYFNFIPSKGTLENFGEDLEQTSAKTRTAREQLKESEEFQAAYGQTITQIGGMSDEEAQSALTLKGLELVSQGMAKDQVQLLIDTIKEEAGKSTLKFNFKEMKFDDAGIKSLNTEVSKSLDGFQKEYKSGLEKVLKVDEIVGTGRGTRASYVEKLVPNKEARAAMKNASAGIASYSKSINRLVSSGSIDVEQFDAITSKMFNTINKSVPDANVRLSLFNHVLKSIDPALENVGKGVTDLEQKQLLLKAAIAGVSANLIANAAIAFRTAKELNKVAKANLEAFGVKDLSPEQAKNRAQADENAFKAKNKLNKMMKKSIKIQEELNKMEGDQGGGGQPKFSIFKELNKNIKSINDQKDAFIAMRKAGIDAATASELAGNPEMAQALVAAAQKGGEAWSKATKKIKEYTQAQKLLERTLIASADAGDYELARLNMAQKYIEVQEHIIDMQNADSLKNYNNRLEIQSRLLSNINKEIEKITTSSIAPLEKQIRANNYALEEISAQEDEINKKYDKQFDALDKIKAINQDINQIQQQRISIADALTQGDIAQAAQLVAQARQDRATTYEDSMRTNLEEERRLRLEGLGRTSIEEKNKKLNLEITRIKRDQIDILEDEKELIEININSLQDQIDTVERLITKQKDSISVFGMTKLQIDNAAKALDLAKNANIDINDKNFLNNVLKAATGDATALSAALLSVSTNAKNSFNSLSDLRKEQIKEGTKTDTKSGDLTAKTQQQILEEEKQEEILGRALEQAQQATDDAIKAIAAGEAAAIAEEKAKISSALVEALEEVVAEVTGKVFTPQQFVPRYDSVVAFAGGGMVKPKYFANGSMARGTDTIPAMLTPGEFVIRKNAVENFGVNNLNKINDGAYDSGAVYNYNLSVNVKSDANPNDIARTVISQIKQIDSQRIRNQR